MGCKGKGEARCGRDQVQHVQTEGLCRGQGSAQGRTWPSLRSSSQASSTDGLLIANLLTQ